MILGIGTDITDVARIQHKVEGREDFRNMVFSEMEIAYCEKNKNPYESYGARFAAKEAFLKALGTGLNANCELREIEVENKISGSPCIKLSPALIELVKKTFTVSAFKIHISLSHTTHLAQAFLIIESNEFE